MNSTTLKFNISAFSRDKGKGQDYNKLRDMLTESNYAVSAEKLPNGDICMVVKDINEGVFTSMADRCKLYESEDYIDDYDEIMDAGDDLESMMCDGDECYIDSEDDEEAFDDEDAFNEDIDDTVFDDADDIEDTTFDDDDDIDDSYFDSEFDDVPEDDFSESDYDYEDDFDPRDVEEYDSTLDDDDYYQAYDIDECIHEALKPSRTRKYNKLNENLTAVDTQRIINNINKQFAGNKPMTIVGNADGDAMLDINTECSKQFAVDGIELTGYKGGYSCNSYEKFITALNSSKRNGAEMVFVYLGNGLSYDANPDLMNAVLNLADQKRIEGNDYSDLAVIFVTDGIDDNEVLDELLSRTQLFRLPVNESKKMKKSKRLNESTSFDNDFARFQRDLADDDYLIQVSCDGSCDEFFDYNGQCDDIDGFTNYVLDYGSYACADEEEYNAYQERLVSRMRALGLMAQRTVVEKRKGCCPPVKKRVSNVLRPISEAFTAYKEEDQKKLDKAVTSIQDVVKAVKNTTIGAAEVADAFKKLKKQQNEIKKIPRDKNTMFKITDVPGVAGVIKKMIEADPDKAKEIKKFRDSLTESVITSIAAKKKSLHENVKIDGKKVSTIGSKTLLHMLKEAVEIKKKFTKILSESVGNAEKTERAKKVIGNKNMLITVLAEELSYRKLANDFQKSLLEAEEEEKKEKKSSDASDFSDEDLAAMMGGIDNTPDAAKDDSEDDVEETEEFDIARIAISVASEDAANELKDLCIEAGIPEEAIEIETGSEEEDGDNEDGDKEAEKGEEKDEEKDEDTNESIRYSNIRKLFEAEGDEDAEDTNDGDQADDAEATEDADAEEDDDKKADTDDTVKFILTDTDYLDELINVLEDNYGITKKEFEEMAGFDIVDAD